MANTLSQIEQVMMQNANLYSNIRALENAIKQEKPELIALYMSKVVATYNKIDKSFTADCESLRVSVLEKAYG